MKKINFLILLFLIITSLFGQLLTNPSSNPISTSILIIQPSNGIPTKSLLSAQTTQSNARLLGTPVNFTTPTYVGTFTTDEMAVCQKALDIWKLRLNTNNSVAIRTIFSRASLGAGVGAGARLYWATSTANNTTLSPPYANYTPVNRTDILYAMPLLINLRGANIPGLTGQQFELDIQINSDIPLSTWHLDPTAIGNCPIGKLDLLSAIIHEVGHALGFASSARLAAYRIGGSIFGYDTYINNYDNTASLESQTSGSTAYNQYVTSGNLFFKGPNAIAWNNNIPVKVVSVPAGNLYQNSQVSHLDENVFIGGQSDNLMSPGLAPGEVIHNVGNVALGVMQDIGWDVNYITYNIGLEIGKMSGATFTTTGLTTNFCESVAGYSFAVKPTQNNGSTVTIPNGNVRWYLYAYHTSGKENILTTTPTGNILTNTTLNVKSPFVNTTNPWIYNANGTILGELRVIATGSDGNNYTTALQVAITKKPDAPSLSFHCCNTIQTVSYGTPRATSYQVYKNNVLVYTGTNTSYSFTPTRFGINNFYVKAINCAGTTQSATGNKNCFTECNGVVCAFHNDCTPLPEESSRLANVETEAYVKNIKDEFKITFLNLNQLQIITPAAIYDINEYTVQLYSIDGQIIYNNSITKNPIDLSSLNKGVYIITIQQNDNIVYKNKIVVQ